MTTRDSNWPEGYPAWSDLVVPDCATAREFYTGLFGWDFQVGDESLGYYSNAQLDGRIVAGIGQNMPGQEGPPPAWTTYLAADDVHAVTDRATAAGATVVAPPMQIMEFGSMAVLVDPTGTPFGLWQGKTHTGAQLVNEPGAMVWNEAGCSDVAAASTFYRDLFGYGVQDMSGEGFEYTVIEVDGHMVGGVGGVAPGASPGWLTYFAVADTDTATARAQELGGSLLDGPRDSPYGRIAVLAGLAGERFAVIKPA